MGRIITFILGVGVVVWVLWYVMYRPTTQTGPEAAAHRLENVRQTAGQVEADLQQKAEDLLQKTE
ncbi:hypothetical protein [Myxococcus sp. RHSTA-1-4]|uniref:hypothetical protein n=1 Tax=Myxococcus sp. RHSTA-1-4 TaxID=2874601 RepID=UPI001CC114A5|nr:hypothetical protein [Myxococcus sp. RHSTA-1-4]MBZ4419394.1 hypothetical protein [Myxococcus sp. RHSTA-1-4]